MPYTDADLVHRYLQLREYIAVENAAHAERIQPYVDGMTTIENVMQSLLIDRGADNSKTEHGTFFKVRHMNTKVVSRDTLFQHVIDSRNFDLLTAGVSKDSVKAHIEASGGHPPPGVEVTYITKINVRKS